MSSSQHTIQWAMYGYRQSLMSDWNVLNGFVRMTPITWYLNWPQFIHNSMQCSSSPCLWMMSSAMLRCSIFNIWTMCTESGILEINGMRYDIFTIARLSTQYSILHHNPPFFFCEKLMASPLGIIISGYANELNLPEWQPSTSLLKL